jgi:hypothetical protein
MDLQEVGHEKTSGGDELEMFAYTKCRSSERNFLAIKKFGRCDEI